MKPYKQKFRILIMNFSSKAIPEIQQLPCYQNSLIIYPRPLTPRSYWQSGILVIIYKPKAVILKIWTTSFKKCKRVRTTSRKTDFKYIDLELWLQGHSNERKHCLSSTHHKQSLCLIWTLYFKKLNEGFTLRAIWQILGIFDLDFSLQCHIGDLKPSL